MTLRAPWPTLDKIVRKMSPGSLVVLIGPPKSGKTSTAVVWAKHMAKYGTVDFHTNTGKKVWDHTPIKGIQFWSPLPVCWGGIEEKTINFGIPDFLIVDDSYLLKPTMIGLNNRLQGHANVIHRASRSIMDLNTFGLLVTQANTKAYTKEIVKKCDPLVGDLDVALVISVLGTCGHYTMTVENQMVEIPTSFTYTIDREGNTRELPEK